MYINFDFSTLRGGIKLKSVLVILSLLLLLFIVEYPKIFIPLVILTSVVLFIMAKKANDRILKEEQIISQSIEKSSKIYNKIKSQIDIPSETRIVHYKGGDVNILEGNLQVWLRDGILYFFPFIPVIDEPLDIEDKVYLFKINIRDITYFFSNMGKETILKYSNKGEDCSMVFLGRDYLIFKEILPNKVYKLSKTEERTKELVSNDR